MTVSPVQVYSDAALRWGATPHSTEDLWGVMGPKMRLLFEERAKIAGRSSDSIEREFWECLLKHIIETFPPCHNVTLDNWLKELQQWFGSSNAWKCYEDTIPCLEALKEKGIRLALISNWDSSLQKILHELNLSDYFEVTHISAIVGWRKPSANMFTQTLDALELPPEDVYHVGDNIADDIYGALKIGITPLFVDRWNYSKEVPATRITKLTEIVDLFPKEN